MISTLPLVYIGLAILPVSLLMIATANRMDSYGCNLNDQPRPGLKANIHSLWAYMIYGARFFAGRGPLLNIPYLGRETGIDLTGLGEGFINKRTIIGLGPIPISFHSSLGLLNIPWLLLNIPYAVLKIMTNAIIKISLSIEPKENHNVIIIISGFFQLCLLVLALPLLVLCLALGVLLYIAQIVAGIVSTLIGYPLGMPLGIIMWIHDKIFDKDPAEFFINDIAFLTANISSITSINGRLTIIYKPITTLEKLLVTFRIFVKDYIISLFLIPIYISFDFSDIKSVIQYFNMDKWPWRHKQYIKDNTDTPAVVGSTQVTIQPSSSCRTLCGTAAANTSGTPAATIPTIRSRLR